MSRNDASKQPQQTHLLGRDLFPERPIAVAPSRQSTNRNGETEIKGAATMGTRWLCRQSAPPIKRGKKTPAKLRAFTDVHTSNSDHEDGAHQSNPAVTAAAVMSHACFTPTERMQPSTPHICTSRAPLFCDIRGVLAHQCGAT